MRRQMFAFVFVALPLAIVALPRAFGPTAMQGTPTTTASGLDLGALDRTAEQCVDFYQFACGGWIAKNPVPPDRRSWTRANELQERNFTTLRRILETPAASGERKKASDYYAACTDERAIEAGAMKALQPELTRIAALTNIIELPAFLAHLHDVATLPGAPGRADESPLFLFGSTQDFKNASQMIAAVASGGYALPDRDQYLKTDERSRTLRTQYVDHIRQMFVALGQNPEEAARDAGAVLTIETALAKASLDVVARREPANLYHVMSVSDLQKLTPHFDWQAYLTASRTPAFADDQRDRAGVRQGDGCSRLADVDDRSESVLPMDAAARRCGDAAGSIPSGGLRVFQQDAARTGGAASAVAPMRVGSRRASRRGARQGVCRRDLRSTSQS